MTIKKRIYLKRKSFCYSVLICNYTFGNLPVFTNFLRIDLPR